jgi:hypothetical protein
VAPCSDFWRTHLGQEASRPDPPRRLRLHRPQAQPIQLGTFYQPWPPAPRGASAAPQPRSVRHVERGRYYKERVIADLVLTVSPCAAIQWT